MKVRAPSANTRYFDVKKLIHGASLHTICEEARCPNIAECWGRGTATFQILGDTCTRACRYCYVNSGTPSEPADPLEPLRLAQTASEMGLEHVVVTSVDRDDLRRPRRRPLRGDDPGPAAEAPRGDRRGLTPDFLGVEEEALATVLGGAARRLQPQHRDRPPAPPRGCAAARRATTARSRLLRRAKEIADYPLLTKSGIIVGLGERNDEVVETMRDLRAPGRRRRHDRPVPAAEREARDDRPLGAPRRVPLAPRAGRGARVRLGLRGPARPLELPRRRAAPRRRVGARCRRLLTAASAPARS